jgi:carbamoyltransferase
MPTVFGFKGAKHAGKFMGMAPYCEEVPAELNAIMSDIIKIDGFDMKNTFSREHRAKNHEQRVIELKKIVGKYEPPEVARALQERTEEVVTEMVNTAISMTGHRNVALAGGVFANVKVNQRVYTSDAVEGIFIHQNMGDGGLGLGAALDTYAKHKQSFRPNLLDHVYLGPSYNSGEIENAIKRIDIPSSYKVESCDDQNKMAAKAADLLADGKVVNLFNGGMEYGPRALGNRSILYQPTDPSSIKWLNEHLERTEFMPFAPVTLAEYADECYLEYDRKTCPAADFMTITFNCTEEMQERSPGAVHIDGTARPQIIREEVNPYYHKILDKYRERTGIPTLINTSFNMHGEPIVCKPSEAIRSFLKFGTKALVLENTLITKEDEE